MAVLGLPVMMLGVLFIVLSISLQSNTLIGARQKFFVKMSIISVGALAVIAVILLFLPLFVVTR